MFIRWRAPPPYTEGILDSINSVPSRLAGLAKSIEFRKGPFPLYHTDLYSSNIIVDSQYNVLSIIDWDGAYAAPWELVEVAKDLSVIPLAMDINPQERGDLDREALLERRNYVGLVRRAEELRGLDARLSTILGNAALQDFASSVRLYEEGRVGYYVTILAELGNNEAQGQSRRSP